MKKEIVKINVALHPIQARIIRCVACGEIDLEKDTLREIAKKINWKESPQQIKHHLDSLVKIGAIQKLYGNYVFIKTD